ncbi:Tyrosine-protein kinase wzc [Paraburkholderia ultramafica]|uniref:Putative tyrosine-protein kinase EpsB n=1 Tax=Paraburkholderia ultramafica TaxID=1544867 RepID=A0A6S7AYU8_9BURK|nr:polysaccharide biosynthesis tyrosine autokinase [Paraburkholderia ultramafica]CAB3777110.1 Tyrosine-protein kinase wzc [Paraburkholderia ultramafica]
MNLLKQSRAAATSADDEIDLSEIVAVVRENRLLISLVTAVVLVLGTAYALFGTPVYRADAMIQVDDDTGANNINQKLGDLASLFQSKATADAEIELVRSRMVIGEAVRSLHLDISAKPHYFPVIGEFIAKHTSRDAASPVLGLSRFAWGGEQLKVTKFDVPGELYGDGFTIVAGEGQRFELRDSHSNTLFQGRVGNPERHTTQHGPVELTVAAMTARPGTTFDLTRSSTQLTIEDLRKLLDVREKVKQSGIIAVTLDGTDAAQITAIVNAVARTYVQRNVDRKSAQAKQMLSFLGEQLPQLRADLDDAEQRYNSFRAKHGTVDLEAEGKLLLQSIVDNKTKLTELQQQRADLAQRFTSEHPSVLAIDAQIGELRAKESAFDGTVGTLPDIQQQALQLMRDVQVNTELYTKLLDSTQQLRVLKAGQLGNVRTVDYAVIPEKPVKPKKLLLILVAAVSGLLLGCTFAFVRRAFNRGLENPAEIERAVDLPVYAIISRSRRQSTLQQSSRRGISGSRVLAVHFPEDIAVEGIRGLRTALQFGILKPDNNIVMLTGPRPEIGKSFLSVNLAAVLAAAGKRVLLVDADMRRGNLYAYFELACAPGLSDVIGGTAPDQAIHRQVLANLDFLTNGAIPSSPSELLASEHFGKLMAQFSKQYDVVIVDSPPVLAVTDPVLIGKHAGATLLVMRHGRHSTAELIETTRQLSTAGVAVDGILLTDVPQHASTYGAFSEYEVRKARS